MDWFDRLTGFRETSYAETRARLEVEQGRLRSRVNGASYAVGLLELISLQELRAKVRITSGPAGHLKASIIVGDVRRLHGLADNAGALFQVASQFNLLEMVSPHVSPEQGVTRYQNDHTQGPACAIAAGAATIYRNYFVPVGDGHGQTRERQLDGLEDLGTALGSVLARPAADLWTMQNGYALATRAGLDAISQHLASLSADRLDTLQGLLRIGLQSGAEVTDAEEPVRHSVSQAFCSALPIAYSRVSPEHWAPFAQLILEAAYEATLYAAAVNAQRGISNVVFLTLLGGGAFGNDSSWIYSALRRALGLMRHYDLDVRLVSYGPPSRELEAALHAS